MNIISSYYCGLMIGTIINVFAIVIGSSIGLIINNKLPQRFVNIFFQAIGLFTLYLGFSMAIESTHILHMILSLIIGAVIGEALHIQKHLENMGEYLKKRFKIGSKKFTEGIITAFLLYCIGSLTIIGALEAGITGDHKLILIKSVMDGVSSIALASAFGVGVMFSVLPLLIVQGGITLLAAAYGDFIPAQTVTELSAVGGILLIGLGISILEIKKINVINMLPALIMIVLLMWLIPNWG